ncbi:hypothetical protein L218DRAFT_968323 [Marasmius fiardii PR-910]|nr:hypothetical protein L218DRAFT_968323 [Marasmius fiardii PR-910]
MPLTTGLYSVVTKHYPIGRSAHENTSMEPKLILKHPKDTPISDCGAWFVKQIEPGSDRYTLSNKDGYTCKIDDKVFAIMEDKDNNTPPEEWIIMEVPQHGPNKYIIMANNKQTGWIAPEGAPKSGDVMPIDVIPIPCDDSNPPMYLPRATFIFTPVQNP